MKHLSLILDRVASELEARGLTKLAFQLDQVTDKMDTLAPFDPHFKEKLEIFNELVVALGNSQLAHNSKKLRAVKVFLTTNPASAKEVVESDPWKLFVASLQGKVPDTIPDEYWHNKQFVGTKYQDLAHLADVLTVPNPGTDREETVKRQEKALTKAEKFKELDKQLFKQAADIVDFRINPKVSKLLGMVYGLEKFKEDFGSYAQAKGYKYASESELV